MVTYSPISNIKQYTDLNLTDSQTAAERPATGANLGFKFRLKLDTSNRTADKNTGNRDVYHYTKLLV